MPPKLTKVMFVYFFLCVLINTMRFTRLFNFLVQRSPMKRGMQFVAFSNDKRHAICMYFSFSWENATQRETCVIEA